VRLLGNDSFFARIVCVVGVHGMSVRRRATLGPPRWLSMELAPNVETHLRGQMRTRTNAFHE
jgi:hypothetical protein